MKKFYIFFLITTAIFNKGWSQQLNANFSYSTFSSPTNEPYLETYLYFNGNSLKYILNSGNTWQATVEVTYIFKQEDKIIDFKKYNIESPICEDSSKVKANFYDQQRISLPNGRYDFEITLKDINSKERGFSTVQEIEINYNENTIELS